MKIFSKNQQPYYLRNVVFKELFWDDPCIAPSVPLTDRILTDNIFERPDLREINFKDFLPWKNIQRFMHLSVKFPELDKFFDCQVTYLWRSTKRLQLTFNERDRFFFGFLNKKHEKTLRYSKHFVMIRSPDYLSDTARNITQMNDD